MKTILRTLLLVLAALPAFAADSVAFITNMKGDLKVDGNPRPVLLAELARGQKLALGKEAQASVMFVASGREFVLKGPGEYAVADNDMTSVSGAPASARDTQWRASNRVLAQAAQTSAASVRMRSVAPAKVESGPRLVYPVEGAVSSLQPTFRWSAADPKAAGEFKLMVAGQDKPVLVTKTMGTTYRLPAKLRPETDYTWLVTSAGAEVGSGKFRTLSADAVAQVEKRRPADKAEFSDRLMYALMLQEMGATQDAQESWGRLARERADLPELESFSK